MKKYGIEENDKIPKKVYEILTDSSYIFPEWDQRIKIWMFPNFEILKKVICLNQKVYIDLKE